MIHSFSKRYIVQSITRTNTTSQLARTVDFCGLRTILSLTLSAVSSGTFGRPVLFRLHRQPLGHHGPIGHLEVKLLKRYHFYIY
jgi:hypothetical protein